jgi:hypothetical protein
MARQCVGGRPYRSKDGKIARTPYYCINCGRKQRGKTSRCKCGSTAYACQWSVM